MHLQGYLTDEEYEMIATIIQNNITDTRKPDFLLYLDCKPWVAEERMKARGRAVEKNVNYNYLSTLHISYRKKMETFGIPVVRINYNEFLDVKDVFSQIPKKYF